MTACSDLLPEAGRAAASARRASRVGTSPAAGYQTHGSSDSGLASQSTYSQFPIPTPASQSTYSQFPIPTTASQSTYSQFQIPTTASQSTYSQFPIPTPASSHRREAPGSSLTRPTYAPDRSAGNTYSYVASQEYDEGTRPSDPPLPPPNAQHPEEDLSPDAGVYDATNDAFFFPTYSTSTRAVQRRREILRGTRGAADR
jgi:hypothetical protein